MNNTKNTKTALDIFNILLAIFGIIYVIYGFSTILDAPYDALSGIRDCIGGGFALLSGSIILAVVAYIGSSRLKN